MRTHSVSYIALSFSWGIFCMQWHSTWAGRIYVSIPHYGIGRQLHKEYAGYASHYPSHSYNLKLSNIKILLKLPWSVLIYCYVVEEFYWTMFMHVVKVSSVKFLPDSRKWAILLSPNSSTIFFSFLVKSVNNFCLVGCIYFKFVKSVNKLIM